MALFSPLDAEKNTGIIFQHLEEKTKPFQHQKKNSYQKEFSSHSNSTVSVENNYFSRILAIFLVVLTILIFFLNFLININVSNFQIKCGENYRKLCFFV